MIFNNYISLRSVKDSPYEGKSRFYHSYYSSAQNVSSTNLPQGLTWNSAKSRYESIHSESVVSKIRVGDRTFEKYVPDDAPKVTLILNNSVNRFSHDLGALISGKSIFEGFIQYFPTTSTVDGETVTRYGSNYNTMEVNSVIIKNPMLDWTTAPPAYEDAGMMAVGDVIYTFDFADGVAYDLSNFLDNMKSGASKSAVTYVFYLDHLALKSELLAKANQYTTITCYHLNGTEWT